MHLPPDLVIFDCDGVLVDSEPITNRVVQANLAGYGLQLTQEETVAQFVGGTMKGVMERAIALGADLPDTWLDEIYSAMFAALATDVDVIPGVPEMLDRLDGAGILVAVGSNGPHAKMDITLERTGLLPRFAGKIVSHQDVPQAKPAPDVYLEAARRSGVVPARAVVVEDSVSGAKAGKAAGMFTLGYAADTDPAKLAPICDVVFQDMSALPGLLGLK
ncbi:HAD family hydrolase [Primorskyibacter sp. S187A]|uniref:HAD family hydrolase n=1 Tax=Primorskyibacter sp. S187A TaxID=3415130 RepID=UPI003C79B9FC